MRREPSVKIYVRKIVNSLRYQDDLKYIKEHALRFYWCLALFVGEAFLGVVGGVFYLEISNLNETPLKGEILVTLCLLIPSMLPCTWLPLDKGRYIFVKYLCVSLLIV